MFLSVKCKLSLPIPHCTCSVTKVAAALALLCAANVQSQFCEQHQLLLVVALFLILIRYRTLLVAETDFFNPILQTFWKLATVLSIEPPPHNVNTDNITADAHKQNTALRTCTSTSKTVDAAGVESTDHEKSD